MKASRYRFLSLLCLCVCLLALPLSARADGVSATQTLTPPNTPQPTETPPPTNTPEPTAAAPAGEEDQAATTQQPALPTGPTPTPQSLYDQFSQNLYLNLFLLLLIIISVMGVIAVIVLVGYRRTHGRT